MLMILMLAAWVWVIPAQAALSPLLRCYNGLQINVIVGAPAVTGPNAVSADDELDSLLVADTGGTGQVLRLANASLGPGLARLVDAYDATGQGIIAATEITVIPPTPASMRSVVHPLAQSTRALISDYVAGRLYALGRDRAITPIAGVGTTTSDRDARRRGWDGFLALQVPLNQITKADMDPLTGRIWFAEQNSHLIRLVLPNGTLYTALGTGLDAPSPTGCVENTVERVHLWYLQPLCGTRRAAACLSSTAASSALWASQTAAIGCTASLAACLTLMVLFTRTEPTLSIFSYATRKDWR